MELLLTGFVLGWLSLGGGIAIGWFGFARIIHRPEIRRRDEQHCAEVAALNRKIDGMDTLAGRIQQVEKERSQSAN